MKRLFLISILFLFIACGGGGGGGGTPPQTAPKITNVVLYNADNLYEPTTSFQIGDYLSSDVYATDPDLDMIALYVMEYYPHDSDSIYQGPIFFSLSSQSAVDQIYTNIEPILVVAPSGTYRLEVQIEDARGNESNIFTVYFSKHEAT